MAHARMRPWARSTESGCNWSADPISWHPYSSRGSGERRGHLIRRLRYRMRPVGLPLDQHQVRTTGSLRIASGRGVLQVATFESTVTIARPVEDVYRFFFEFDKNAGSLGIDFRCEGTGRADGGWDDVPSPCGVARRRGDHPFHVDRPQQEDWIRREGRSPQADRRIYLRVGRRRYETDGSG